MRYDPSYHRDHKLLKGNLEFDEYTYMVNCLNDTLKQFWPCNAVIYIGYILSPFTLGLSFMLPNLCIADAKDNFLRAIARQNRLKLNERGLQMRYVQGVCTSWIEIVVIKEAESANERAATGGTCNGSCYSEID